MANGNGGGGPRPPEKLTVECKTQAGNLAYFEGNETSPDAGDEAVIIVLGNSEYFKAGKSYNVVFDPIS